MNKEKIKPKIFHGLVNYGTQSGLFARELRKFGYEALSVTYQESFKRITDVQLEHGGDFFQKVFKHAKNFYFLLKCFFKYDIFHFYFGQTLLPRQLDLPFYKIFGKKVIMEYLGNDIQGYSISVNKYKWTNIVFMMSESEGFNYDNRILNRFKNESKYVNNSFVCAPYLCEFAKKSKLLPLAIDLNLFQFSNLPSYDKTVRIMHAPTHRGFKGTSFIEDAVYRLINEGYNIDFDLVENVTHDVLLERYKLCHLFIDQIMCGWYGTSTIEAMAVGRPVIVSIRQEYIDNIDFIDEIPAIHADPDNIYDVLKKTLDSGFDYFQLMGQKSRNFVEKVHDVKLVTKKLINFYSEL